MKLFHCQRCGCHEPKRGGSWLARGGYALSWLLLSPYVAVLSVSGLGVFGLAPLVMIYGCCAVAAFHDASFPRPLCARCGASLEHAEEALPARSVQSKHAAHEAKQAA